MNASFSEKTLNLLKATEVWTGKTRQTANTVQGLLCLVCGDYNAWAYTRNPRTINCNHLSKCGSRVRITDLIPELRRNIEKDFPPTKADPHRPAREYLLSRGFSEASLKGLDFRYQKNARNSGSGAVLFPVGKDDKGKEILNGRLFAPPSGEGKTHNVGSTTGRFWQHPGIDYDPAKPTWITEGIFDALSLIEIGHQAIAVLSAGQDPAKPDLSFFRIKVIAFDNDEAGHRACRKWKSAYPDAEVILCDQGKDWNDLLQTSSSDEIRKHFPENLPRYRLNGELALAGSASQYGDIFHKFYGHVPGLFTFHHSTYFSILKTPRGGDLPPYVSVTRCLKGTLRVISFIQDRANPAKPEYLYNLEFQPEKGKAIEAIATGADLASNRKLNEWCLSHIKATWEGDARACTALATQITGNKAAPEVRQLTVIGYHPETAAYILPSFAIDTSGKRLSPTKRGFFQFGYNQFFRPPAHSDGKDIAPAEISMERVREIYSLILNAWGNNGIFALSWTIAGWFVNQIKEAKNFFPFLSLHGDPASGKSALTVILNALQGRDGEGLPITQLNSKKGLTRTIGQLSGLFTALLEDNDRNDRAFDWSIILTAFNRGPLQVQATFSNDLQTRENPFLGTLLFCQNLEPFDSKAERQRVISLHFKADQLSDTSRAAYDKLMALDKPILSGFMLQVLTHRKHFEDGWRQEYEKAIADLNPMDERRILQNHALILAFHRLFCSCFGIDQNPAVTDFFADTCRQKCISSAIRQTSLADYFFELLDTLTEEKAANTYHFDKERKLVYVNLPNAEHYLRNKGVNFQVNDALNLALHKHPAFLRNGLKYRFPADPEKDGSGRTRQRKVWVFDLEWFVKNESTQKLHNTPE